jgi:ribosomal protein RSM22 (predicted rRNA methylase)
LAQNIPAGELAAASAALTARYRGEVRDGARHVATAEAARAYAIARLPATYAAVVSALAEVSKRGPVTLETMLDVGSGPGTAIWAAREIWSGIKSIVAVEASPAMIDLGRKLWGMAGLADVDIQWQESDAFRAPAVAGGADPGTGDSVSGKVERVVPNALFDAESGTAGVSAPGYSGQRFDLVTMAYVLNEISMDPGQAAVRLWEQTGKLIVIVEPGTPAGWKRILAARTALISSGAHIVAPCPHAAACPIVAPDWCHFSQRVARSRLHRLTKEAALGWEDEKFIYIAASRTPIGLESPSARVLAPPRTASGRVWLKLCQSDGNVRERLVTKREGEPFKQARRTDWGQTLG